MFFGGTSLLAVREPARLAESQNRRFLDLRGHPALDGTSGSVQDFFESFLRLPGSQKVS